METIQIKGAKRENFGKKGSKDVRREGRVPAVIYGGHEGSRYTSRSKRRR